jgi:polyadenylate-binding protein
LYCAIAQRKDQRRQQLEQQYARRPMVPPQMPPMGFPNPQMGFPYPPPGMMGVPAQGRPQGYPYPPMQSKPRWVGNQPNAGRGFPQQNPMVNPQNPQQPTYAQVGRSAQGRGRGGKQQPNNVVVQPGAQQGGAPHNRQQRGQGGNFKFAANARNRPQNEAPQPQQAQQADDELNSENLADLPESKQKNILGERLYPLVERVQPDLAPKITGMLLDMEVSDIIHLIESPDALSNKITEAVDVLAKHSQTEQAQDE